MNDKNEALFARIDDLCRAAEQGMLGESCFLSPAELHFARLYLAKCTKSGEFLEWGGFASAQRKKIFLLPEYAVGVSSYAELDGYGFEGAISAVSVLGSGYKRLCHRDFLGAVLALGLDRRVLGDIVFFEGERPRAVIVCESAVADFIAGELKKVGSDTVKTEIASLAEDFEAPLKFEHISDTVASSRVDCVVAALCGLSRQSARDAVLGALVEVDYECEQRADRTVSAPCLISVRGYGKFRINSVSEQTRKGRYRLDADKFV